MFKKKLLRNRLLRNKLLRNKKIFSSSNKLFLIGLTLTILLQGFIFFTSLTIHNTYLNRLYEMDRCFKDNQIPCRWIPNLENFYGSPIFNYHPPLPYYFGEAVFLLTQSLTLSLKVILSVSLIGSYLFMYFFALKFFDKFKANLLAIVNALLSFLVIFFFKEGLGVAWGLMSFALILLSFSLLAKKRAIQNLLFTSLSLSFLILSADLAIYFIGLSLLWTFFYSFRILNSTFIFLTFCSVLLAILLSSFYTIPAILEKNLIYGISPDDPLRYLPKSAGEKPQMPAESSYHILTGESDIFNFKQGTNWFKFQADTKTHTIVRLSQFYFPNFKIFIDGKETKVEYKNNSLGLMTIILGRGNHIVEGRLFDTSIRTISNFITVISIILILILWIIQLKGVRLWLNYYRKRVN